MTFLGGRLIEDDGLHHADAAVVLGGDEYATRITKAAQIAQAGYAPIVLVSGPPLFGGHETDFTIPYAVQQGYPAALFHAVVSSADSTRSESAFLGDYLHAQGIHSILLVTSNFHTRRAARLMRKQNPDIQIYVEPAPDRFFSANSWWKTRSGQKTFLLEWTKTISTWFGV